MRPIHSCTRSPDRSKAFPYFEGTGGLYLREGGEQIGSSSTARHVVLPLSEYRNELYTARITAPRREIIHLGSKAYQNALESIMDKIEDKALMIDIYKDELKGLGEAVEGEDAKITTSRKELRTSWRGGGVDRDRGRVPW
jgi:hypothetical protein